MENLVGGPWFWSGRRVFLTGHTGFKGSWLALWLAKLGAHVTGFSLPPPTQPAMFTVAQVEADLAQSVIGDIRDVAALDAAVRAARPEIVFHLAAQPIVLRSYDQPAETFATNVMGTVHLLDALRRCDSVRAAVIVTSDKCYENQEWVWGYRETDAMGGFDPYSSSKGCCELVTAAYRRSYFNLDDFAHHRLGVASVRAGNVIGGGDWAENRLIPDLVRGQIAGTPVPIRNPHAIRPWQHVLEPLSGYLCLARRLIEAGADFAEAWNFGPLEPNARPVGWIAGQLQTLWSGTAPDWVPDSQSRPHENIFLKLDCSKAAARLGWQPQWDIDIALAHTVAWYMAWHRGEDMHAMTISQITDYGSVYRRHP